MWTHCVFFWCPDSLSKVDRDDFEQGLRSLLVIASVVHGHVGTPAPIDRPVVDRSYSFALLLRFTDKAAHDAYQTDPVHNTFHARCAKYWNRVVAYDFIDGPGSP